jgi:hypothetical protein
LLHHVQKALFTLTGQEGKDKNEIREREKRTKESFSENLLDGLWFSL